MGLRSPEPTLGVQRGCGDHQGHHLRIWGPSGAPRVSYMAGSPAHLHHLVPWHQLQGLRVPVKRRPLSTLESTPMSKWNSHTGFSEVRGPWTGPCLSLV